MNKYSVYCTYPKLRFLNHHTSLLIVCACAIPSTQIKMATPPKRVKGRLRATDSAKKRSIAKRNAGKVNIFEQIEPWKKIKEDMHLSPHAAVAEFLIIRDADEPTNSSATGNERNQEYRRRVKKTLSQSFVDPFDLSIDVTFDEDDLDNHIDDPDYEPSFNITIQVKTEEDVTALLDDNMYLTYLSLLMVPAKTTINAVCQVGWCKKPVEQIPPVFVGSAVYLKWQ
ncbi:uncharacterized protein LOC144354122 [Saccoglossus kowalevskii]